MASIISNIQEKFAHSAITYDEGYVIRGIAMLMIIFVHSINEYPEYDTDWSHICMIPEYGIMGCSLFFFMSGYGIFQSLARTEIPDNRYYIRHLKKLILPFIVAFIATCFIILIWPSHISECTKPDLTALLALSMPNGTNLWFFKAILANYIVTFLLCIYKLSVRNRIISLLIAHSTFIILGYIAHIPGYWYYSNLAFVLGASWTRLYSSELFNRGRGILYILSFFVFLIYYASISMGYPRIPIEIAGNLALCIILIPLVKILPTTLIQNPYLQFIGKNSLYYYLFNVPIMTAIPSKGLHYSIYFFANLLITSLAVLLWRFIRKQ